LLWSCDGNVSCIPLPKPTRKTIKHREMVATHLACLNGIPNVPIADTVPVEPNTSDALALPTDANGCAAAIDRSTSLDRLSPAQEAGQKAVDLLSTVSGHGAHKLLLAARRLVDQSLDPCHAIAAWYQEYNCENSRKKARKGGRRPGNVPGAGRIRKR
jgi:hypothetical protein